MQNLYPNRLSRRARIGILRKLEPVAPSYALIVLGQLADPRGLQSSPAEVCNDPAHPAYAAKRVLKSGAKPGY